MRRTLIKLVFEKNEYFRMELECNRYISFRNLPKNRLKLEITNDSGKLRNCKKPWEVCGNP